MNYDNTLRSGCYIDESAGSADCLNTRVIEFAQNYGFPEGVPLEKEDAEPWEHGEALNWVSDSAVDWLNDQEKREGYCWLIDENSLFLSDGEDDFAHA